MDTSTKNNVIVGAGKFSHVHLRCLADLEVNHCIVSKQTDWTDSQKRDFVSQHPNITMTFDNNASLTNRVVHIVTPSETHLKIMERCRLADRVFVEKPSVLYNRSADFEIANSITGTIYQNDWLAQIVHHRTSDHRPSRIKFRYQVKDRNTLDLVTEVASHFFNLLTVWCAPNCDIQIKRIYSTPHSLWIKCVADDIQVDLNVTSGKGERSIWLLEIDDEVFTSENMGGRLMLNTLSAMLTGAPPTTDWYQSSWMIHRFRLLSAEKLFQNHFAQYYRKPNGN